MIRIRRSAERGHFEHGWLDTHHTFSFGDYFDPAQMGFRALRVINEDRVQPGEGFGTHPHRDMEIVTYVLEGALAHRDGLGHSGVLQAGGLQRITAGTGITHSEFNASRTEPVHFYQIWLKPERAGLEPGYEQTAIDLDEARGGWRLAASPEGLDGSLTIRQDARLWLARLDDGGSLSYDLAEGRHAWLQVARGSVAVAGQTLEAGDGAAISQERSVSLTARGAAEVLLFDLA